MIRIDPSVTELPEPIPWVRALTIQAAVMIGLFFLAGCAQPIVWDASGTQFKTDDYECTRDAMYMPNPVQKSDKKKYGDKYSPTDFTFGDKTGPQLNEDLYIQCMEAHGYTQ